MLTERRQFEGLVSTVEIIRFDMFLMSKFEHD
nr:MAG TPA: hypothetical protein [Caudoviricetes sp.]